MRILLGIDGTGPMLDSTYGADFADSFVRRLCPEMQPQTKYFRGPVALGNGMFTAIAEGTQFVVDTLEKHPDGKVHLTGYSRGGFGVLVVADKLRLLGIPVESMLLFDAVDRYLLMDAESVPENVKDVLHMRRSLRSRSRPSFGNCGTQWNKETTTYKEKYCFCTHGGVGGTPWSYGGLGPRYVSTPRSRRFVPGNRWTDRIIETFPDGETTVTFQQDKRVAAQVWEYVQAFIRKHGLLPTAGTSADGDARDEDPAHEIGEEDGEIDLR